MKSLLAITTTAFIATLFSTSPGVAVERLTVREMVAREKEWDGWIQKHTVLQITGRYEGRFAKKFRLFRLPVSVSAARTTTLPRNVESGQRVSVTGSLKRSGKRLEMEAQRIAIGADDFARLATAIKNLRDEKPSESYAVVARYAEIAAFYKDEKLTAELQVITRNTFSRERQSNKENAIELTRLAERGTALQIPAATLQAIKFESLVAELRSKNVDLPKLESKLKRLLPEWNQQRPFKDKTAEKRFLTSPVAEYDKANGELRLRMHRRFYRQIKLPMLLELLNPDSSNAEELARIVESELPEEVATIAKLNKNHVDYRLSRIARLTRRQLEEVEVLLKKSNRGQEFPGVLNQWIKAQETRSNNGQLDGILATSEEYLYAFERWKQPAHQDAATQLLKQAWTISQAAAPKEARQIAIRLEQLGWTRLHDEWLTTEEVTNLPKSDVQLAMREGRVVPGMKPEQILGTLGEPSRRIRIVSALHVQEIWIYGEAGSTTISIHLNRSRSRPAKEAVATRISKGAG